MGTCESVVYTLSKRLIKLGGQSGRAVWDSDVSTPDTLVPLEFSNLIWNLNGVPGVLLEQGLVVSTGRFRKIAGRETGVVENSSTRNVFCK